MSFYSAPFTFNFLTELIAVDGGTTDILCADLYTAIKAAQASAEGIQYPKIGEGSGLIELGPGVEVGLTVELLGNWQLSFATGNYVARVAGGNLVGGPGGDPVAYSAGVQTLLIQSAASTVVTEGGSVPTAAQNAAATWAAIIENGLSAAALQRLFAAVLSGNATVPSGAGAFAFRDLADTKDRVVGTIDNSGAREVTDIDGT
jgi:hypothetical protein